MEGVYAELYDLLDQGELTIRDKNGLIEHFNNREFRKFLTNLNNFQQEGQMSIFTKNRIVDYMAKLPSYIPVGYVYQSDKEPYKSL